MTISALGRGTVPAAVERVRAIAEPAIAPVAKPGGRTVFAMFPITCPACRDAGREVTMAFLDHTLRFGDPIIRARSSPLGEAVPAQSVAAHPVIGEPLTADLDGAAYLSCPDRGCGRRSGPYTARDLRHRLLRSWR